MNIAAPNIFLPCHSEGDKPPFICVHPIGGGAVTYYHLLRGWSKEIPLIAIQMVLQRVRHCKTIAELAAYYVRELILHYPANTYYLGGWSFGGIVALEMAKIMQMQGYEIPLIILYDSYLPDLNFEINSEQNRMRQFAIDIASQCNIHLDLSLAKNFSRQDIFHFLQAQKVLHYSMEFAHFSTLLDTYLFNRQLYETYQSSFSDLRVHMFRCTQPSTFNEINPDRMWQNKLQSGNYQLTPLDTDHYKLFSPPIAKKLAEDTCRLWA